LRLSFNAPHTPVVTPAPFDTLVDPSVINLPLARAATDGGDMTFVSETHRAYLWDYAGTQRLTDDQIRRARQCYYGYVACVDHVFGHFMDALAAMGELDNTMIVYVADHGAHLGDHGFFQKQSFWDVSARVPFFFTGPGIRQAPAPLTGPVSAGSLLPTLLDLAGLEVPPQVEFPSLKPVLCGDKDVAPAPVFSEIDYGLWGYRDGDRYVMVREGPWKLSLYRDPADSERFAGRDDRVLFNLDADPGERHNLAYDSDYKDVVEDLIARIDRWDRRRSLVRSDTDRK
jgi:arylsulfatase A-like enzyme